MVMMAHMWIVAPQFSEWRKFYFIEGGVDLFFGISGFIIVTRLLPVSGSFRSFALPFWIRRVFRLWPAAMFWALVTTIFAAALDPDGRLGSPLGFAATALFASLNIANLQAADCAGNGVLFPCDNGAALGHYWSLSLEEQFYWVIPFVLYFCPRKDWLFFFFASAGLLLTVQNIDGPASY